jgi:hypothetical protein
LIGSEVGFGVGLKIADRKGEDDRSKAMASALDNSRGWDGIGAEAIVYSFLSRLKTGVIIHF